MNTIVLADDDSVILESLRELLQEEGYIVKCATNGIEAFNLIDNQTSLLITDLNMPELDGIGLLRSLKEKHSDLNVVAMSGHFIEGDTYLKAAKLIGAKEVLKKPLNIEEFISLVNKYCV